MEMTHPNETVNFHMHGKSPIIPDYQVNTSIQHVIEDNDHAGKREVLKQKGNFKKKILQWNCSKTTVGKKRPKEKKEIAKV